MPKVKAPDIIHEEVAIGQQMRQHMPEYSQWCPTCQPRIKRNQDIIALYTSLKEFGYSTVTRDEVATAYDGALAGEDTGADIIRKLVRSQMVEAGLVKADA